MVRITQIFILKKRDPVFTRLQALVTINRIGILSGRVSLKIRSRVFKVPRFR